MSFNKMQDDERAELEQKDLIQIVKKEKLNKDVDNIIEDLQNDIAEGNGNFDVNWDKLKELKKNE